MTTLTNEAEADAEVEAVLSRHNKQIIVIDKEPCMLLVKDGRVVKVADVKEVDRSALVEGVQQAEKLLADRKAELTEFDRLTADLKASEPPTQPANPPAAVAPAPQAVAQPAPAPVAPTAPQTAVNGAAPAVPTTDGAVAPTPPAPITLQ